MGVEVADALLLAALAGSAIWLTRIKRAGSPTASAAKNASASMPTPQPASVCPAGFLPVLDANALYQETRVAPLLFQIGQALGFAPENHAKDVQPLLDRVAEFVQLLPGSESHHHANPGGLLSHLLEVAAVALLRCEEAKLPIGRPTEVQLKFAARWRYGVLVAALLHDIGKPIADVIVEVLTEKGSVVQWSGLGGSLAAYGPSYTVRFPLQHDYGAHQRLPVMLLKTMVPASTMLWLADDRELMTTLIAYLSGESDGGAIGRLVKDADGKSVADNLLTGSRTRFATARQVPLIERMMDAIRRMLAEGGQLPLNREGATGFCDGTDIWFVAGTIADKVRAYLDRAEIRELGAADLPTDNSRLFDTWFDYAAVKPNAGAAIWKAQIILDKGDGKAWKQTFTMLRFPLEKLYASTREYPQALTGSIEVLATPAPALALAAVPSIVDRTNPETGSHLDVTPCAVTTEAVPLAVGERPSAVADFALTPVPVDFDSGASAGTAELAPQPMSADDEFLDQADSATAMTEAPQSARKPAPAAPPTVPTAPVAPASMRVPEHSLVGDIPQPNEEIERMMAWIQQGVGSGAVAFNRASASVHFVKDGMLLISPKIFREFLEVGGTADGDGNQVKRLQRLLQKSGYAAKNRPNSYLHYYRIINAKNPERSLITGYLIANPRVFFNPVPEPNCHLEASAGNGTGTTAKPE